MLTNQNWIHILIHKLIYFMHIDKIYSQQKAKQMRRGEHSTWPLQGDTYQEQMSDTHKK